MKKLLGIILSLGLLTAGLAGCSEVSPHIEDAHTVLNVKITNVYSKKMKKKNKYKYYVNLSKGVNRYHLEIEEKMIYKEIKSSYRQHPREKYDIIFSEKMYSTNELIGMAYSKKRR